MSTPSKRLESLKNKTDTRRKILIGAYVMDKAKKNGTFSEIIAELNNYLTRNSDRALFDLPETM